MTIKELRTKEGLSQAEMAKRLGIVTSAIGHRNTGQQLTGIAALCSELPPYSAYLLSGFSYE